MYCTIRAMVMTGLTRIRLEGLDNEAQYRDTKSGNIYAGDYLMKVGLYIADDKDFETRLIVLERLTTSTTTNINVDDPESKSMEMDKGTL